MSTDGLDIPFLEQVNRRMATVYAILLVSSVIDGVIVGVIAAVYVSLPLLVSVLAGLCAGVLVLALLRVTLVRQLGRRSAEQLSKHCAERRLTRSALDPVLRSARLEFVLDLFSRHGARAFEPTSDAALAGERACD